MTVSELVDKLTAAELHAVRTARDNGTLRAIDNRTDGRADCDALTDARRIGERIADGFALLTAAHDE